MPKNRIILTDVSFSLPTGEALFTHCFLKIKQRISAIIRNNGINKTMLAKIICSDIQADHGKVRAAGRAHYVAQSWMGSTQTTLADLLNLTHALDAIARIEQGVIDSRDLVCAESHWDWQTRLRTHTRELFLRFEPDVHRRIDSFSSGEQFQLLLLVALWYDNDILILDEPSNYLDANNKNRLLHWIQQTDKTIVLISHDAQFIDIADEIWEVTDQGLHHHRGGYARFQSNRLNRIQRQQGQLDKIKLRRHKQTKKIQTNFERAQQRHATAKRQAKSVGLSKIEISAAKERASANLQRRRKIVDKQQLTLETQQRDLFAQQETIQPIMFEMENRELAANKTILETQDLQWGFNQPLQPPLTMRITGATRIHLQGGNGSGKSTLLRTLMKQFPVLGGEATLFVETKLLDQNLDQVNPHHSALATYTRLSQGLNEQQCRDRLAWLGLRGDMVQKSIKQLSGGSRLKLALAITLLGAQPPQLLLLDEPTNHLDLLARETLTAALINYHGAIIVASHDQYFIDKLGCNKQISLGKNRSEVY